MTIKKTKQRQKRRKIDSLKKKLKNEQFIKITKINKRGERGIRKGNGVNTLQVHFSQLTEISQVILS